MPRISSRVIGLPLLLALAAGCSPRAAPAITLATTTSTRDTGLLDVLVPMFQAQTGIEVKVVAVGTGQALALGRNGDADVLLVHDPEAEARYMEEGHGSDRLPVMHNDFVLVGPPADPAGAKEGKSVTESFTRISRREGVFVSRADGSGTHAKEQVVWQQAGLEPQGPWYLRSGSGMAQALRMADEKRAYTLSDRGTFLALRSGLDLAILREGDPLLKNPYHVIVVNGAAHPSTHQRAARQFADFLRSPEAQQAIAAFGVDRFGQPLFFPDAQ
jgi:tungstate transport system substrate-binding protein